MATVFGLLFAAFGIAVAFNQGWVGDRTPWTNPATACVPWKQPPPPSDITVNVYNSTTRKGLAKTASQALAGQQFRIQAVGNDPLKKTITAVAEIRYAKSTTEQAKVLAARFPGAKLVQDKRTTGILDVSLGQKFTKVVSPKAPVRPENAC